MRILITILLLIVYTSVNSQPKKLTAETSIQNVTIFSSGARVERIAGVNIHSGRSEISFGGLSNQLDQQTVQLKADANVTLLSVQTTKDFLSERKLEDQEKEFIDRMSASKDKIDTDQKLLEVYKNEEAILVKNQAIGGQTGVKTIDLKEAVDFQRSRLTELYTRELEIQKRLVVEQQNMERYKLQLQEFSKKKDSISYIVTALVESKENRIVNFQLLYNIKDAGWYPTYDVRVNEINEPLAILMNANIFQRSGETWKNITLELSTGNPKDNATPSELLPWMLGFYDPSVLKYGPSVQGQMTGRVTDEHGEPVVGASVTLKNSKAGTVTDNDGFFRMSNMPKNGILSISSVGYESREFMGSVGYITVTLKPSARHLEEVVVTGFSSDFASAPGASAMNYKKKVETIQTIVVNTKYQPTATIYKIDDKYTLESDGKTTTIGIRQLDIPAIYDYYSAPKIDPTAFLTAKIVNWQDLDLMSGEVSLYYEGAYLGKTYVDLSTMSDTLSLSLGRDNAIKVSRKMIKEYSTKKFIGSNRTDSKEFEISIRNSKKVAVNITILDQIPVSVTKEINVEDVKTSEAKIDKDTGIATWSILLAPVQEKKLSISYNVKYPKDRKVQLE